MKVGVQYIEPLHRVYAIIEGVNPRFIVDLNVGKLAKRLRMSGYDTLFIKVLDNNEIIRVALEEERILLTKDTGIMKRRVVFTGKVVAILIESDNVREQLRQVVQALQLAPVPHPFSLCMECNEALTSREKEEVCDLVPPYVFKTQEHYMQCPNCLRVYWRGTHWQGMQQELEALTQR